MRLRDFSTRGPGTSASPVLIDPPYAGHSSSIADYAKGQSLVETLHGAGHDHILVMDWKSATAEMRTMASTNIWPRSMLSSMIYELPCISWDCAKEDGC